VPTVDALPLFFQASFSQIFFSQAPFYGICAIMSPQRLIYLVLSALLIFMLRQNLSAQIPADAQEIYVETTYKRYVRTVLVCQYYGDSVYVPLRDVFMKLSVDIHLDMETKSATGFFIRNDSTYHFDFQRRTLQYAGKTFPLPQSAFLVGTLDVWVLPSVLARVLGLMIDIDVNNLAANISSSAALPAEEQYERKMRRKQAELARQRESEAEGKAFARRGAFFDRSRHVLNGGFFSYSLSSSFSRLASAHSYSMSAQAELFGGELQASALGTIVPLSTSMGEQQSTTTATTANNIVHSSGATLASSFNAAFRWDYALKQNAWLTHIRVGTLPGFGSRQGLLLGVQLSNEPLRPASDLGSFTYSGLALPKWEIEAYLNSQFVGVTFADSLGRYSFSIPLQYGSGLLQLKLYGTRGEIREETHRVQVPASFAPVGEFRYVLTGGMVLNDTNGGLSLKTSYGLASWLSAQASVELDPFSQRWTMAGALSARLGTSSVAAIEAAPGAFYRATFSTEIGTAVAATLSHTQYADYSLAVSGGKAAQTLLSTTVSGDIAGMPINLRLQAARDGYPLNVTSYSGLVGFAANLGGMRLALDARGFAGTLQRGETQANGSLVANLSYSVQGTSGFWNIFEGTMISAGATYQLSSNQITDIRGEISRSLWQGARLRYLVFRDMSSGYTGSALQLSIDASFLRTTLSATLDPQQPTLSASVQGSIAYDRNYGKVFFTNTPPTGGAASVRLFLDKNGNGVFDGKDEVLKNASVAFKQSVIATRDDDGIIRVKDLTPYAEYEVSVDENSLDNPLLLPASPGYVFIADPAAYKPIDIPLVMAGAASGIVRLDDEKRTPVPGLNITFRKRDGGYEKTTTTFGDGTFYQMGLPPGAYTVALDSNQLTMLKVNPSPEKRFFTVRITADGDMIDNLDFTLIPRAAESPAPAKTAKPRPSPKTKTDRR
jgi:hypothetical protein